MLLSAGPRDVYREGSQLLGHRAAEGLGSTLYPKGGRGSLGRGARCVVKHWRLLWGEFQCHRLHMPPCWCFTFLSHINVRCRWPLKTSSFANRSRRLCTDVPYLQEGAGLYVREGGGSIEPQNQILAGQTGHPGLWLCSAQIHVSRTFLTFFIVVKQALIVEPVCSFQWQKKG